MSLPDRPLRLIGEPRDVSIARAYLRRVLERSGVSGAGDDAATVLSELVTRALLRGRSPILVSASVNNDEITLVVDDAAPAVPRQDEAAHSEERIDRHAAALVAALTRELLVVSTSSGDVTTAVVPLVRPAAPGHSRSEAPIDSEV